MRDPGEIWENAPEGLTILNPAFETVSRRYIDGLITEAGIFASSHVHNYFTQLLFFNYRLLEFINKDF